MRKTHPPFPSPSKRKPARLKFVARHEFDELQNEIDDLRQEVYALKQRLASA